MTHSIADRVLMLTIAFILALVLAFYSYRAAAQEHEHGTKGIPDWYDTDCCNKQDCRPVLDQDVNFGIDELNNPIVIYKDLGHSLNYEKARWRKSKDERYHACFRPNVPSMIYTLYCIYLPTSV
jgi:uncharacterized membrane protein YhdT